jgi:hypothetical protein
MVDQPTESLVFRMSGVNGPCVEIYLRRGIVQSHFIEYGILYLRSSSRLVNLLASDKYLK